MKKPKITKMKKGELQKFKQFLLAYRRMLTGDKEHLENEALSKSRKDASGDISNMPFHLADLGSDNYEQEFSLGLVENEEEILWEIDGALERIENKTFGICQNCGKKVKKTRLKTIPFAKLCIKCQREEEAKTL